jgi:CBS domain-containing protein
MKITQLLTPMTEVRWLSVTDTVGDAFDHIETYGLAAAPLVDWGGRYVGTVTEADLRRYPGSRSTPLSAVERRARNPAVYVDGDASAIEAASHPFVPVVDGTGRLVGIVERRRPHPLPHAA